MIRSEEEHLAHYGILRRSGRYPWGSGASESTRNRDFLDVIQMHKNDGMTESQIARAYGITVNQLRACKSIALAQQRQEKILTAQRLADKGWGASAIGRRMGLAESSVRALLAPGAKDSADALQSTANMLKEQLQKKEYLDIGQGVENQLGVTRTRLDTALAVLREQGYEVHTIYAPQVTQPGKFTGVKVLAPPGTTKNQIERNRTGIKQITDYSEDTGRSFLGVQDPISINSRRIAINYAEDGGAKADGVIYVRPGVKDLSIGNSRYAQVRVAVDGTHYLKGMAVYKDDLPDGVDLVFNTNKSNTGRKKDAMKPMETDANGNIDWDNPFGSIIRQVHDATGKVTSAMNIVGTKEGSGEEGAWDTWKRSLPSQMLSKQSPKLAKQQLNLTYERRQRELDEINALTNPSVRKKLLETFADQTDAAAVHLEAANLPRQATKVLMPITSMKKTEAYVPTLRDGERIALVRFPHGGTFEIPELTVNNRNREAQRLLGKQAKDAIGIHHSVAQRLSGADFDGDTVLVIPNNRGSVKSTPALEGLKGFDPQQYKIPKDSPIPRITSAAKQQEMGKVSNLITDMTLRGAKPDELANAIRHSMVVIDSEKHELDYKQSEKDNRIASLKEKYQGGKRAGASTIISRATSDKYIPERRLRKPSEGGPIDPVTGKKVYVQTGRMVKERKLKTDPKTGKKVYVETGKTVPKKERVDLLSVTEDAHAISSGIRMEEIYADHSNKLKAMANTARKTAVHTKPAPYEPSANRAYSKEVASIKSKLNLAQRNAPLERQAQLVAQANVSQKRQANPNLDPAVVKKIKNQALTEARVRTGAKKTRIQLTQAEWDAIQAGAISPSMLDNVLKHADVDSVRQLALPKQQPKMTSTMRIRAQSMMAAGYTQAEIADQLGVGLTTLKVSLSE